MSQGAATTTTITITVETIRSMVFFLGASPHQNSTLTRFLLFQKRSKSVSSASRKLPLTQTSAKPTQGVWGRAPSKTVFFSRKEPKATFQRGRQSSSYFRGNTFGANRNQRRLGEPVALRPGKISFYAEE
jgi:uncharacterized membrane protein